MLENLLESTAYALSKWPLFAKGAVLTVEFALIGLAFGTAIGLAIALMKISHNRVLNLVGGFYTWIFRGTPLLVQIYIIYFGLPGIGIELENFTSAALALSLCAGAYIAEIIRSGIQSIDRGQLEAAQSLGMTYAQAMRRVIIPQTYRRLLPPMGNEFISLLKDTSLISIMSMVEILRTAQLAAAANFRYFEMYVAAGVVYLALTTVATFAVGFLEKKLAQQE